MTTTIHRTAMVAVTALALGGARADAQIEVNGLSVHGYLTQGAAVSSDLPTLGIPVTGTQDYRAAALQLRYAVSEKDHLLIQLSHRRFGSLEPALNSPATDLGWAFYQRKFGSGSSVKLGKIPIPRGIYNEVRMVGTVLPFYRAPYNFYSESFETINGGVLGHIQTFGAWSVEGSVYAGSLDFRVVSASPLTGGQPTLLAFDAEHAVGGQLWLNTPVNGVRMGVGGLRMRIPDMPVAMAGRLNTDQARSMQASIDATRDRFFVRGEYAPFSAGSMKYKAYYAQAGVRLLEKLWVNGQADVADASYPVPTSPTTEMQVSASMAKDWAVGTSYQLGPNVVFKVEGHKVRGYAFDTFVAPNGPPGESTYGIASIAVSF